MDWKISTLAATGFMAQLGVACRLGILEICTTTYAETYACQPFPQLLADIFGSFLIGMTSTALNVNKRRHAYMIDFRDSKLPILFPSECKTTATAFFVFRSGFCSSFTSFSAWIISSAKSYYTGDYATAIFTIVIPGMTFFAAYNVGEILALAIHRRLSCMRDKGWIDAVVRWLLVAAQAAVFAVAVCVAATLMYAPATHWHVAILLAPVGACCRILFQAQLNTSDVPFGTMLSNISASGIEAVLVTFASGRIRNGVLEGFVASFSTVSSFVDEITYHTRSIIRGVWRSDFLVCLTQIVLATAVALIVFAAGGGPQ